ncbi:MAG: hypothetical protein HY043_12605 [Verrucomicrobia bacterium]|nr:hypothetical protein [Verrucomicrobiota bacterium]
MIEPFLKSQLEPVARRQRRLRLWRELAVGWLVEAAFAGALVFMQWLFAWHLPFIIPLLVSAAAGWALIAAVRVHHWHPDYRNIARRIEQQHPRLHALLLTAIEQQPDPATGKLNYLQERVIREAVIESQRESWLETISTPRLVLAQGGQWLALAVFGFALLHLRSTAPALGEVGAAAGVTVSPGDAEVERGNAVAVLARFQGRLPADVTLIVHADAKPEQRIPLAKSLADPIFGTSIPEVTTDLTYAVEYGGRRITVAIQNRGERSLRVATRRCRGAHEQSAGAVCRRGAEESSA